MSIESLKTICEQNNIKYSIDNDARRSFNIQIPKGRSLSQLSINDEIAEKILNIAPDFYKYKFVDGYEAIWSSENGTLECEIQLPNGRLPLHRLFRQSFYSEESHIFSIPSNNEGVSIEISGQSNELALLTFLRDPFPRPLRAFERIKDFSLSIKISGLNISRHDHALDLVEKVCSAICFQIDCITNQPVMLGFERKARPLPKRSKSLEDIELAPIKYAYDKEALSLYWYAQSAYGMPLLKYLALYQVVEFYYPVYSEIAAQKKVRNILKTPNFNANNDKDLSKVMNIIKYNPSARAFGNELSQLKATILECLDIDSLREWLSFDKVREEHFRSPNAKKLSEHIINTKVEDDALLEQVVQRFYNIRCRIVHTKGLEGNLDVLHPQAKELAYIDYDVELANFITHKVMIASSHPITSKA
ncbi:MULTISPECIES: hypothetical protein [Klebsiella]|uniref:hypothetical protein n=1 Tax=Klebsiella michiganensis TaxID=1134687 RepID=UPI0022CDD70A|nr:hypothetical protein [Klebsiella michiganensis]WBK50172.1 hypothetical protein OEE45_15175 [Klebsiella michiganensis]HBM3081583.1 hypothetical protein [Klebsiella michiganensis]